MKTKPLNYRKESGSRLAGKSALFCDLEQNSFKDFFEGLEEDPRITFQKLEESLQGELPELFDAIPHLRNRTFVDILLVLPDGIPSPWKEACETTKHIFQVLDKNFNQFMDRKLNEGLNLAQIQIESIREFMNIDKNYRSQEFKNVFKDNDDISQNDAERLVLWLEMVSTLVPDKYKKNLPEITVIIKEDGDNYVNTNSNEAIIVLNTHKKRKPNLIEQLALALHEYLHLIEKFNPSVHAASLDFLKSRILEKDLKTLGEISDASSRVVKDSARNDLVYVGKFLDLYMGKTYGDLDSGLTEIFSVGGEALIKNPLAFYLRDPEHFILIYNLLKNNY